MLATGPSTERVDTRSARLAMRVLRCVEQVSLDRLLAEIDYVRLVVLTRDPLEMHSVVHLVLRVDDFVKREVIVPLFERVKVDLLVVLGKETA